KPTPARTRNRAAEPRYQPCDSASIASIAEVGAAGYSVTVAHPAAHPTASAQRKSARALELSRSFNAAPNAKTRQAPTSACAQNNPEYAHIGVPKHITTVATAAPPTPPPNRSPRKNRQTAASAVGSATALTIAQYERATPPRGNSGSIPIIRSVGLAANANGTAKNTSPGALSE